MKKLVTAVTACMLAGLVSAAVESINAVGYVTHDDGGASENVANVLRDMNTVNGDVTVTSSLWGYEFQTNDQILQMNLLWGDFDVYTYKGAGSWDAAYADGTPGVVTSFMILSGSNFSFVPADGLTSLTCVGEVASAGTKNIVFDGTVTDNWQIANPFPIETTFGDLASFFDVNDQILRMNLLWGDLDVFTYKGAGSWDAAYADGTPGTVTDPLEVVLPVGKGAFYISGASQVNTWTVTLNY